MERWKSRGGKSQRREEKKREDQRRERVRRTKMQVHEKVEQSQNTVFFQWFVAPEGRKVACASSFWNACSKSAVYSWIVWFLERLVCIKKFSKSWGNSVIASYLNTASKRFNNVEVPVEASRSLICRNSTASQALLVKAAMTLKAVSLCHPAKTVFGSYNWALFLNSL